MCARACVRVCIYFELFKHISRVHTRVSEPFPMRINLIIDYYPWCGHLIEKFRFTCTIR